MPFDIDQVTKAEFWEDPGICVAGEWEGDVPEISVPGGGVLFRTSGTTGVGKWVVLGKEALLISARAVNEWLEVREDSKWGLALPSNHVGGFGVACRAYVAGCGFEKFSGKWDARGFARWTAETGVTHTSLVPTQVHDLVGDGLAAPEGLSAVVVGGGRLEAGLGEAARELGWPVLASYGMTEACSQIATQRLSSLDRGFGEVGMELLPIWDAEITPAGLLLISGDALFHGTIAGNEFLKKVPGGFLTNDRARLDGRILIPEGRADSLVKVMGELVDIEAVERAFIHGSDECVEPGRFAVVAVPDERREHALVGVFEGGMNAAAGAIRKYQESTGGLSRLDRFVEVETFPRTGLGKLRRAKLAELVCADS